MISIIKDNTMLDQLFNQNLQFVEDLEELIVGGHIKLDELKAELNEMELNSDNYEDYEIADKRDFIDRLGKYFIFAEITNLVIGTTTVDEVWVINYSIGDKTFDFTIESDLEEITLGLTLDWYLSAIEVEKLRTDYYNKYTKIKTDLKSGNLDVII